MEMNHQNIDIKMHFIPLHTINFLLEFSFIYEI